MALKHCLRRRARMRNVSTTRVFSALPVTEVERFYLPFGCTAGGDCALYVCFGKSLRSDRSIRSRRLIGVVLSVFKLKVFCCFPESLKLSLLPLLVSAKFAGH